MISGIYFDGQDGTAHEIQIALQDHAVHILGLGIDLLFPVTQLRLAEPFRHAPGLLKLGNGAHCEIHDIDDKTSLIRMLQYRPSQVERWQSAWLGALCAIVIMLGFLFSVYYWGIPKLTATLIDRIPASVETKIGTEMLPVLDQALFTKSKLANNSKLQAQKIFDQIKPDHPRLPLRLIFRASEQLGANAIALPDGTIVVTDAMVNNIANDGDLTDDAANQLSGILAHEIGHIEKRHTLKALLSNSIVTAVSASLFGDFSAVVTAVPTILVGSEYSREMESDADNYAIQLLEQNNISPICMAQVFELLHKQSEKNELTKMPRWMRFMSDFSSSHPSDAQRIERFRTAASQFSPVPDAPKP